MFSEYESTDNTNTVGSNFHRKNHHHNNDCNKMQMQFGSKKEEDANAKRCHRVHQSIIDFLTYLCTYKPVNRLSLQMYNKEALLLN